MEVGQLFLITQPELMRGFDYRCNTGIALLVCKNFDSLRALKQGFNRVGRFDEDACFKGVLPDLHTL